MLCTYSHEILSLSGISQKLNEIGTIIILLILCTNSSEKSSNQSIKNLMSIMCVQPHFNLFIQK